MHRSLLFVAVAIGILFFIVSVKSEEPEQKNQTVSGSSNTGQQRSSEWYKAQYRLLHEGRYYPHLPRELNYEHSGKSLVLLQQAASRKDIVVWVDRNKETRSAPIHSNGSNLLVIMDPFLSGRNAWVVYLYAYQPLKKEDPKPWKQFYVGSMLEDSPSKYGIDTIYTDAKAKSLVLASRTGEIIKTIKLVGMKGW